MESWFQTNLLDEDDSIDKYDRAALYEEIGLGQAYADEYGEVQSENGQLYGIVNGIAIPTQERPTEPAEPDGAIAPMMQPQQDVVAQEPVEEAPAQEPVEEAPAQEIEPFKIGGVSLADIEVGLNAPFSPISRGVINFFANSAAAVGLIEQEKVDTFFKMLDEVDDVVMGDSLVLKGVNEVGKIAGQYVLPAVGMYKAFRSIGRSHAFSSILSESLVGLMGTSPNDGNLFNELGKIESKETKAIAEFLGTNPNSGEWTNRTRNAVEALVALGASQVLIDGIIKMSKATKEFLTTDAGQRMGALAASVQAGAMTDPPDKPAEEQPE